MIDLSLYTSQLKRFNKGSNPLYEIKINNTRFLFKETNPASENLHIVEPFISQYLQESPCKRFVPYYPAKFDDKIGVLSKFFLDENEQEFSYLRILQLLYANISEKNLPINYQFTKNEFDDFYQTYENDNKDKLKCFLHDVSTILENVKKFCELYNIEVDLSKIKDTLTETVIYDYFLGNEDRNWQNLSFIVKNNDKKITLFQSPLFDHEYCLNMYYYYDKFVGRDHNPFKDICSYHIALKQHYYPQDQPFDGNNINKYMVQDTLNEVQQNPNVAKQVSYCLNFKPEVFLHNIEKKENIKISEECKNIILHSIKSKISYYKQQEEKFNLSK